MLIDELVGSLVSKPCSACGDMMHYVRVTEDRHQSCASVRRCEACGKLMRGAFSLCRSCDISSDFERMKKLKETIDAVFHLDPIDERYEFICRSCLQVKSKIQDVRLLLRADLRG